MKKGTRRSRNRPAICVDQHIDRAVASAFRPIFQTIEAGQSPKLRGRDELDFLPELSRQNAVFVTSDKEFVDKVLDTGIPHAGIVFIPQAMTKEEKVLFAEIVGGYIQGMCIESRANLKGRVIYPAEEGLRSIKKGKDELEFSWDWLGQLIEAR